MQTISIKRYLPRRLYGRAVLILLVPIVFLQFIVGIIIIQRHFDGVTSQLARGVALEIAVLASRVESMGELDPVSIEISRPVGLNTKLVDDPDFSPDFQRHWWDWSGRVTKSTIETIVARPVAVDLVTRSRAAFIRVKTSAGILEIRVSRGRLSARNPQQLIILMVVAAALLTIISLIFLNNQVKPIRALAVAAEAFGKGRSVKFSPAGAEEVRRAGSAFISMRGRIERNIEQRTMMLSGVSHDLKTPLTRIRLALATAESIEELDSVEEDLSEMERMLEEFLAFARGDSVEEAVLVDPVRLAERIVEGSKAQSQGLVFETSYVTDISGLVSMREMSVRRAVQNLVNNAFRYGTKVHLKLVIRTRTISYIVEDNGPGIPEASRSEAMKPFSRLDQARNQDQGGGVGLGLAIALDIAHSHGGALTLDHSEELGGLRASLMIPR